MEMRIARGVHCGARDVAQPGRAPPLGGGSRRFESGRPDCGVSAGFGAETAVTSDCAAPASSLTSRSTIRPSSQPGERRVVVDEDVAAAARRPAVPVVALGARRCSASPPRSSSSSSGSWNAERHGNDVPSLVGLTHGAGAGQGVGGRLHARDAVARRPAQPAGTVVDQAPQAGAELEKGAQVMAVVSAGQAAGDGAEARRQHGRRRRAAARVRGPAGGRESRSTRRSRRASSSRRTRPMERRSEGLDRRARRCRAARARSRFRPFRA